MTLRFPSFGSRFTGAALSLLAFPLMGCPGEEIGVRVETAEIITLAPDFLRPDYRPLGNQLRSGDRLTYSDGSVFDEDGRSTNPGGAPLSPLVFADIDANLNDQLRRASCLWVDQGNETGRISYEMVAHNVDVPELGTMFARASGCGGELNDPLTRDDIRYEDMDSDESKTIAGKSALFFDVEMTIHTGQAASDPHNGCDAGDSRIVGRPMTVLPLMGRVEEPFSFPSDIDDPISYPFCMNKAALPPIDEDWTMQLDMIDNDTGSAFSLGGSNAPPFRIPTRVKVVPPSRAGDEFLISRPLEYAGIRQDGIRTDGDRTITPYAWTWRAPILPDGRWQENFSPNLAVSRIRVFRDLGMDPDTGEMIREYLDPVAVDAFSDSSLERAFREHRCDFEPATGEEPSACTDLTGFTPTYRIDRENVTNILTDLLTWVVDFNEVVECEPMQRPDGTIECTDVVIATPPIDETDKNVFVEFHLVRPTFSSSGQGLTVRPASSDFGDVRADDQPLFDDVFEVENFGQGNIRIIDVVLEGPDASDFEIVSGSTALAGTLIPSGGHLPIDLRVVSNNLHHGRRQAMLRITGEDVQGNRMTVRADVRATVVDWSLEVLHPPYIFFRHTNQDPKDDVLQFQKVLLLLNSGTIDLPRDQITITGPGAAHWSISREKSLYLTPESYKPWINGEEPELGETISPGGSEILYVSYHPDVPYLRSVHHAPDEAEIRVQVDDTEYVFPLVGYCADECEFNPPTPYAPPKSGSAVKNMPGVGTPALGSGGLVPVEGRLGS